MNTLKVKRTHPKAVIPTRSHSDDAGLDLTAIEIDKVIDERYIYRYDTGIAVKPPEGYFCEVVPRSSMAAMGISLANSIGIIDPSYRGSIKLPIRFYRSSNGLILPEDLIGKRLCQLLIKPLHLIEMEEVLHLDNTARGDGGFGSTGD